MMRLLRLAGLIALVVFALGSRRRKTTTEEVRGVENVPTNELGRFIEVINRVNDERDEEYVSSLTQLRKAKNNVLSESRAILAGRSTASFALRHSVIAGRGRAS
jgi:phosphotransacetylase